MEIKIDISRFIRWNSGMSDSGLEVLYNLSMKVSNLEGCIAEVGVWRGGSSYLLAAINPNKNIHIFDTFEGLPDQKVETDCSDYQIGDYCEDYRYVSGLLSGFNNVHIHKGIFPKENSNVIQNEKFSFVHLDCDLYKSMAESAEFFYPRMVKGGIMLFDDAPLLKRFFDEFLDTKPEKLMPSGESSLYSAYIEKI